jgi:NAD(P)-dependent dehydrogenase (short-subunit alcohol dehydrogenase family)
VRPAGERPRSISRAVVVTGCSSGIGRACVTHLARSGFRVFAGVRRAAEVRSLAAGAESLHADTQPLATASGRDAEAPATGAVVPLEIDVASADSVAAAAAFVAERLGDAALWGVVNNAGIAIPGPLETIDLDDVRRVLEVNLLGPLRVARAFLPALRAARGRIVNVGSGEAFLATPLNGAYCMSKHALEACSEALRLELAPASVAVSVIEPGQTQTAILDKTRRGLAALGERASEPAPRAGSTAGYEAAIRARAAMSDRLGMPPERVAAAVARALTDRVPKARYFVGLDVRGALLLGRFVPSRVRDLFFSRVLGFPGRA